MRFDFLHDGPPLAIERLRAFAIPVHVRVPLGALFTAMLVVAAWHGLEGGWIARARHEDLIARERLEDMRSAFAATNLKRRDVEQLLVLDRRLRAIRLSGTRVSTRFAALANALPSKAWLTSISPDGNGVLVEGRSEGLRVLATTIEALAPLSPALVRAVRDGRDGGKLVSFSVRLSAGPP